MSLTPPGKGYAHFVLAVEAQDDRKGRRQSGRLPSLHQDGVVVVELWQKVERSSFEDLPSYQVEGYLAIRIAHSTIYKCIWINIYIHVEIDVFIHLDICAIYWKSAGLASLFIFIYIYIYMCVYLYITNNVIGFVSKWQTPEFMAIFMRQWSVKPHGIVGFHMFRDDFSCSTGCPPQL